MVAEARAEWRYCFALDPVERRFLVSEPAPASRPMAVLEAEFRRVLSSRGQKIQGVACPRSESRSGIESMINSAAEYNRENGNAVLQVDWSPARLSAER